MEHQSLIQHVVLIIKENHTYDNYFGTFPGANGDGNLARSPNPPAQTPRNRHNDWLNRATVALRQQYIEADIPAYFAYARQFTLADNYFTDVASDSTPNHLMLIAADSPVINNIPSGSSQTFDVPSLPSTLETHGLTMAVTLSATSRAWRNQNCRRRNSSRMRRPGNCPQSHGSMRPAD